YDLDDIVAFYQLNSQQNSPIQIKENSNSSKSYQKRNNNFRKFDQKSSPLHNIHKLNQARIDDIFTYVRIKNRKHESYIGIRNKLALIVRFHSLIVHQGNRDTAETDVKELIDEMDRRETSQEELLRRSQSAERYYNEWLNGDWDRHKYVQGGLFYTKQTLVELLGMQRDYSMQLQLKTIKIKDKAYEKQRMRQKRNSVSRQTYDWNRQRHKRSALALKKQGKTHQEIADLLSVSINTVKYYFKKKF